MTILLSLATLGGCAREDVYRNFYEGFRTQENLESTPNEEIGREPAPGYDQYQQQRKKVLEEEKE